MRLIFVLCFSVFITSCGGASTPREDTSYKSITATLCQMHVEESIGHSVDFPWSQVSHVTKTQLPETYRLESYFETTRNGSPIRVDFLCIVKGRGDDVSTYELVRLVAN